MVLTGTNRYIWEGGIELTSGEAPVFHRIIFTVDPEDATKCIPTAIYKFDPTTGLYTAVDVSEGIPADYAAIIATFPTLDLA